VEKFITQGTSGADTMNGSGPKRHSSSNGWQRYAIRNVGWDELYGGEAMTRSSGEDTDWLYGRDGDDVLDGYSMVPITIEGDVMFTAATGPDYYVGGKGNDTLYGNSSNDTYCSILATQRHDHRRKLLLNGQWFYSSGDKLIFGAGICTGSITVSRWIVPAGPRLDSDSVTIKNWFRITIRVESFLLPMAAISLEQHVTK